MEMCFLRGDCRPGDFGESAVDKDGPGAKHEKQEKVRGLIWARLLIPKNTIWSSARFVMEKENYPRNLMSLMFAEDVEVLDSLKKNLKSWKRWKIENK
jgi:D-mannonate dehydratase